MISTFTVINNGAYLSAPPTLPWYFQAELVILSPIALGVIFLAVLVILSVLAEWWGRP